MRVQAVGELERGQARRLRHRDVIAALDHVEERRLESSKPPASMSSAMCRLYLSSRIEPPSISFELDVRMRVQLLDQQLAAPVIGAAGDRKADPPLAAARNLASGRCEQSRHTRAGS